jgi:hypothetical protein
MIMTTFSSCSECGVGYFLKEEKDGNITTKTYSCGHRVKKAVINEIMTMQENNAIVLVMIFDLYNPITIGGNILNSKNIEFIMNANNQLTQFRIKLINPTQQDEKNAIEKASEIVNYLSIKMNQVVKHKLPLTQRITKGIMTNTVSICVDAIVFAGFDLDGNFLESKLLNKNSDLNKRLQLYIDGLKALENNDFGGGIQSFHQCIENTEIAEEKQYSSWRHATSHQRIGDPLVIQNLQRDGININQNESLNENDPDNQRILKSKANELKGIVWTYLNNQLSNL